jgi:DNA-binding MarR family transcriptional regulator
MAGRLPLPTLLSHALVAFTIEFDNESEHQLPHRTTHGGSTGCSLHLPWLVSLVMWLNCMRFVDEKGLTVRELDQLAGTKTNLNGMERWGYIFLEPNPTDSRAKSLRSNWLIRTTRAGQKAQEIWRPLLAAIENRWQQRFGKSEVNQLRKSLRAVIGQLDSDLPDCLPILGYGLFSSAKDKDNDRRKPARRRGDGPSDLSLPSLLSKVLLAFAIEFESKSEVSLAISADVLRLVGEDGIQFRELPRLAGVSRAAIATAVSFLQKRGYAVVTPGLPGSRVKVLALTPKRPECADHIFSIALFNRRTLANALRQGKHQHATEIS